jgi:hypothetical protein
MAQLCRSTWGDIDFVASVGATLTAAAACFSSMYSKPARVIIRPTLFRKSAVSPSLGLTAIQARIAAAVSCPRVFLCR